MLHTIRSRGLYNERDELTITFTHWRPFGERSSKFLPIMKTNSCDEIGMYIENLSKVGYQKKIFHIWY